MSNYPTCYIVSLKYAPGLWKEFNVLGENLRRNGFNVNYLLSNGYRWMSSDNRKDIFYISSSRNIREMIIDASIYPLRIRRSCAAIFRNSRPAFLCIYNQHPLNAAVLHQARTFYNDGIRSIYLHEPARPNKAEYGWKGRLFLKITELTQSYAVKNTTDIILPSPVAIDLFEKQYPNYNGRTHYSPILIPDKPYKAMRKRKYFSMVGRFNFAKKPELFIEAINFSAEKGKDLEFQIVTASNINTYLKKLTPRGKSKTDLIIKDQLSDEDISKSMAESYAVLCLQPMITQSGVVPVAFMNETPVIVSPIPGFRQFVEHKFNGWILEENFDCQSLVEAMINVKNNFKTLSANARKSYKKNFAEKHWENNYASLLELINKLKV